jgi:poly-gamma-glutamate synthesis protein (capsule biosynthesis protein)
MKNKVMKKSLRKKSKFIDIAAIFISIAVLISCLASVYSCGMIPGMNSADQDGEDLTFAAQNNHARNDIVVEDNINETTKFNPPPTTVEKITIGEETEKITEEQILYMPPPPPVINTPDTSVKDGTIKLSFLAAGDNIIHQSMMDDATERAKEGEKFNFKDMYKDIADIIKAADISFVNMETPIAGDEFEYTGYPNFNTPKENAFAIMDIGFDIVNLANNHMLDKKEKGYLNSINFWDNQPAFAIGGFKDKADFEKIRIYEKNGVTIAFLSYTYGTNGMVLPKDSKMVIPILDDATVERQVKAARPLADLVFVVMHWGEEDSFTPSQWQRSLAQMMADNGVDVIIGMHPHVLQETKWISRPDGKKTLITYSLGNLISNMYPAQNMVGALLTFDIVKTTKNGESNTVIQNAKIIPVVTHLNMRRKNYQVYRFEDYTESLAKSHGGIDSDSKFSYKYLKDIIIKYVAPEFLSDFYKK